MQGLAREILSRPVRSEQGNVLNNITSPVRSSLTEDTREPVTVSGMSLSLRGTGLGRGLDDDDNTDVEPSTGSVSFAQRKCEYTDPQRGVDASDFYLTLTSPESSQLLTRQSCRFPGRFVLNCVKG